MKKIIATMLGLVLSCSVLFAAEENQGNSSGSSFFNDGKNKVTAEAYLSAPGVAFNQAVVYDRMFRENMGAGIGLIASESNYTDFGVFGDFKVNKWNFGMGLILNTNSDANTAGVLMRAGYHGNDWQWGPGKAGFLLGVDWHMTGGTDLALLYFLPRFMFGVNWQLDF